MISYTIIPFRVYRYERDDNRISKRAREESVLSPNPRVKENPDKSRNINPYDGENN